MTFRTLLLSFFLLTLVCISSSFNAPEPTVPAQTTIEWLTWDEAVKRMEKEPKKVLIDLYTDWCGWCKRMDATTFVDPKITDYVSKNFYAVKFDAEQKEEIIYDNHSFKFIPNGRRGTHQLASTLLNNSMSYPSFVIMDEKMSRIMIVKGFQKTADFLPILHFTAEDKHKSTTFEEFKAQWKP